MTRYELLNALLHLIIFFLGAGIGSFLNVVIHRLPRGLSVNEPRRSFCPSCNYQIPFYHNIPILSWILLGGRCANCKAPISPRYLGVEVLVGVLFYAVFWSLGGAWSEISIWGPQVLCLWLFVALLVSGTFIDIEHFILPHEITIGGTVVGILCAALVPDLMMETGHGRSALMSLGSAALGLGLLWTVVELGKLAFGRKRFVFEKDEPIAVTQPDESKPPVIQLAGESYPWEDVFLRGSDRMVVTTRSLRINDRTWENVTTEMWMEKVKIRGTGGELVAETGWEEVKRFEGRTNEVVIPREAMGFGDVLFLMMIGSFLGWKAVLFTILAASVIGTVFALIQRVTGRAEWSSKIPFGPYLAAGAVIWMFWGPQLLDWYLHRITFAAS